MEDEKYTKDERYFAGVQFVVKEDGSTLNEAKQLLANLEKKVDVAYLAVHPVDAESPLIDFAVRTAYHCQVIPQPYSDFGSNPDHCSAPTRRNQLGSGATYLPYPHRIPKRAKGILISHNHRNKLSRHPQRSPVSAEPDRAPTHSLLPHRLHRHQIQQIHLRPQGRLQTLLHSRNETTLGNRLLPPIADCDRTNLSRRFPMLRHRMISLSVQP